VELVNEFRVPVPVDQAWDVLTDVERIAPCLPGAQLLGVEGDVYRGAVKVKVGPITAAYRGTVVFVQKDQAARRAVMKAVGRETRGQGNASAMVTADLKEDGDSTTVVVSTDLTISGKAAQFGRGVLADVSAKLLQQFAKNLEADVLATKANSSGTAQAQAATPSAATAADSPAPGVRETTQARPAVESVDLLKTLAPPVAKRVGPVAAALAAGVAIGFLVGRRSRV
jgi:hypothetical protein